MTAAQEQGEKPYFKNKIFTYTCIYIYVNIR